MGTCWHLLVRSSTLFLYSLWVLQDVLGFLQQCRTHSSNYVASFHGSAFPKVCFLPDQPYSCCKGKTTWDALDAISMLKFTVHTGIMNALKTPTERGLHQTGVPQNLFLMLFESQGTLAGGAPLSKCRWVTTANTLTKSYRLEGKSYLSQKSKSFPNHWKFFIFKILNWEF